MLYLRCASSILKQDFKHNKSFAANVFFTRQPAPHAHRDIPSMSSSLNLAT